ncbi:MAG: hypothetical protein RML12_10185 [Xanthomonadales bacterium]|nr:hypothetical protein [Xanthomonadales bacterium]
MSRVAVLPLVVAGLALAACADAGSGGGTPFTVGGLPARAPAEWRIAEQGAEKAQLVLERGEEVYGMIFVYTLGGGSPETELERFKGRLVRGGFTLRPSGERRREEIEGFLWYSEPIIAEAAGQSMVGIASVHRIAGKTLGSMFFAADQGSLERLVDDYRGFVEQLGRPHRAERAEATAASAASAEGRDCRVQPELKVYPRFGGCIGALCNPTWHYDTMIVPRRVCR